MVDNASTDASRSVVDRYPRVRWVGLPTNEGLGPGYNTGAGAAQGEKLFFVNNDTSFEPDCVRRLVEAFRNNEILAADPLQTDWEGKQIIHGAQRFRWGWRYWNRPVPFMEPYQDLEVDRETEVPWGCAGAILFNRLKFEALEGFDSTFFLDYEDLDLCWRGWLRGWKTVFVPTARLRHRVGPTFARRRLSQYKNAQRFVLKTMPWRIALAVCLIEVGKALGGLVLGRFSSGSLRVRAALRNILELPEIFRLRRKAFQEASSSSIALLRRWG